MKSYFPILMLSLLIAAGCSSSKRFTSENDIERSGRYKKENSEAGTRTKNETRKPVPIKTNSRSLETESGVASFYSDKFHGRQTANGETYDMHAFTAAHETYPFNTIVKVTNLNNNKSVTLRINDRKPDLNGRIIDISYKAAQELDMVTNGIAHVQVDVIEWGK